MFTTKAYSLLLLLLTTHTTLTSQTNHPDPSDPDPGIFQPHYDPSPLADLTFNHSSLPEPFTNPSLDSLSTLDILLNRRQQRKCPDPGGPICSATQCCRTGQQCCPRGCCSLEENCYPAGKGCCPKNAQTCGGSMLSSRVDMRQTKRVLLATQLVHKPKDVDYSKHVHSRLNVLVDSHVV
ncbi:uncharacterized protein C8A04DRAFT_24547 [Dichotomopilus funicola]|uniref:Granulins domain-containing protein n=1 Tax=Dichotomopilus funicola TaxID=1934379 RepID=A0AAN6VA63_9PEZI|nr:hypothetical protein C8A04DRAFT_24547 [Dichotomopilus funicola]